VQKQPFYNILIILKLLVYVSIGLTINLLVLKDAKKNFKCIKSLNFQGWHNSRNALKEKMNNTDAVNVFLALGQETRLNTFRLIVQRGDEVGYSQWNTKLSFERTASCKTNFC
jgi:hypothetical protein